MSHYLRPLAVPIMIAAVLAVAFTTRAASSVQHDGSEEAALFGRLAIVEPDLRRLAVVPDGHSEGISFVLDEDGAIWRESRELSLSALVTQVGSRVKVRYRLENGVRVARIVTVEGASARSGQAKRLLAPTPTTPPAQARPIDSRRRLTTPLA